MTSWRRTAVVSWSVKIGSQRRGSNLPQLFMGGGGPAIGGMTEFFKLCGQGASSRKPMARVKHVDNSVDHCFGEPVPFYCRITIRVAGIQQFPVFDKEQSVDDQGGYGFEAAVNPFRILSFKQILAVTVKNGEPRLALLPITRVKPPGR